MANKKQKNNKKQNQDKDKREKILEFIENNAKKNEFIAWLNAQHDVGFSEDSSWQEIRSKLLDPQQEASEKVKTPDLQIYAASLTSEQDIKDLLQNVEEETKEAKQTAHKLTYLSQFKKFAVGIGGAVFLEGIALLILAGGLIVGFITLGIPSQGMDIYAGIIAAILGIINAVAGLLLATI
ncbi:MAG: hypothetical protein ACOC4Z_03390 [Patescibacteria group bacterium]